MLFGGRCRMAQKSILRSRIYSFTARTQSYAAQYNNDDNFIDTIINIEEDSWITEEKIKLPEIVAPSRVRKQFELKAFEDIESLKSNEPNHILTKTMPAFIFERNHKNIKLDHLENIRNKYNSYGDELILESLGKIHLEPIKMAYNKAGVNNRPSKHQSLQNLGEFIFKYNLDDNLSPIPAVRIHRSSKYYAADYARLINEWSNFYDKTCGIDDESRANNVPYQVQHSLLCQIFELLVLNLPRTTEQNFDILANFFKTHLEKLPRDDRQIKI